MKRTPDRFLVSIVFLLPIVLASGCATYTRAGKSYRHRGTRLMVELPPGWLRYNPGRPAYTLTRDGLRLETIRLKATEVGEELPRTDRVYRENMLPHEVAELSLGLIEESEGTKNFQLDSLEVATVAGHEGYRADAHYVDAGGLPKRLRLFGAMIADHVCEFRFDAAESVYFDKYLPAFERVVSSAKVISK